MADDLEAFFNNDDNLSTDDSDFDIDDSEFDFDEEDDSTVETDDTDDIDFDEEDEEDFDDTDNESASGSDSTDDDDFDIDSFDTEDSDSNDISDDSSDDLDEFLENATSAPDTPIPEVDTPLTFEDLKVKYADSYARYRVVFNGPILSLLPELEQSSDDDILCFATTSAYLAYKSTNKIPDIWCVTELTRTILSSLVLDSSTLVIEHDALKCIDHNLKDADLEEFWTVDTEKCPKCGTTIKYTDFKTTAVAEDGTTVPAAFCPNPNCGEFIGLGGKLLQNKRVTNCAGCGKEITLAANAEGNFYCTECTKKRKAATTFYAQLSAIEDNLIEEGLLPVRLTTLVDNKVRDAVNGLLRIYDYYNSLLDPVSGVISLVHITKAGTVRDNLGVIRFSVDADGYHYNNVSRREGGENSSESYLQFAFLNFIRNTELAKSSYATRTFYTADIESCSRADYRLNGKAFADLTYGKNVGTDSTKVFRRNTNTNKVSGDTGGTMLMQCPGFHTPHIFGYFFDKDNKVKTIKDNREEFEKFLTDVIHEDICEYFTHFTDLLADIEEFYYDTMDDAMFDSRPQNVQDKYRQARIDYNRNESITDPMSSSIGGRLTEFGLTYVKYVMSMFVVTKCANGCFSYDAVASSNVMFDIHGNKNALPHDIKVFNKRFLDKFKQDNGSDKGVILSMNVVYDDMATNSSVSDYVYSTVVVTDLNKFTGLPLFAYKPMSVLKKQGKKFSANSILLGRTLDNNPFYIEGLFTSSQGVAVNAITGGSRSGKGVTTLAMLGALFNDYKRSDVTGDILSNQIMTYVDCKPETAMSVFKIECRLNEYLQQHAGYLNQKGLSTEPVHFLAIDTIIPYACEALGVQKEFFAGLTEPELEILNQRQRNWTAAFEPSMRQIWHDYFGMDVLPPDNDSLRWFYTFLIYSKTVQLIAYFANKTAAMTKNAGFSFDRKPPRFVLFADEVNQLNIAITTQVKAMPSRTHTAFDIAKNALPPKDKDAEADLKKKVDRWKAFVNVFMPPVATNRPTNWADGESSFVTTYSSDWANKADSTMGKLSVVLIGQQYSKLVEESITPTWLSSFATTAANTGVRIFGNWVPGENEVECNAGLFSALGDCAELKSNYIHDYTKDGTSGFFIVRDNKNGTTKTKVVQTYLVLDTNDAGHTESGAFSVKARVYKAFKESDERKAAIRELDSLLFKHPDCTNEKRKTSTTIADLDNNFIAPDETVEGVSNREQAVGFWGYLQYIGGLNFDSDKPEDIDAVYEFIRAFGSSYDLMSKMFLATGFAKRFGYNCIEDYLYDMRPFTFSNSTEFFTSGDPNNKTLNDLIGDSDVGSSFSADSQSVEDFEDTDDPVLSNSDYAMIDRSKLHYVPPEQSNLNLMIIWGCRCLSESEAQFVKTCKQKYDAINQLYAKMQQIPRTMLTTDVKQKIAIKIADLFGGVDAAVQSASASDACKDFVTNKKFMPLCNEICAYLE